MNAMWRGLADGVVAIHYAYLAYLLVGGFIAWRWPRTIWIHALAASWAFLIIATKVPCPLTALQNHFRERAGERPLVTSFINVYIRGIFYPSDQQTLAQVAAAVVIAASWIGYRCLRPDARETPWRRAKERYSTDQRAPSATSAGRFFQCRTTCGCISVRSSASRAGDYRSERTGMPRSERTRAVDLRGRALTRAMRGRARISHSGAAQT